MLKYEPYINIGILIEYISSYNCMHRDINKEITTAFLDTKHTH